MDREERLVFVRRLLTRPPEIRAVNFFYYTTTLLKPFMDSLLTYKNFYVNLTIGKRIIRLHLPILDCGIAPNGLVSGIFYLRIILLNLTVKN